MSMTAFVGPDQREPAPTKKITHNVNTNLHSSIKWANLSGNWGRGIFEILQMVHQGVSERLQQISWSGFIHMHAHNNIHIVIIHHKSGCGWLGWGILFLPYVFLVEALESETALYSASFVLQSSWSPCLASEVAIDLQPSMRGPVQAKHR